MYGYSQPREDDFPTCALCGEHYFDDGDCGCEHGPAVQTLKRVTTHVARKDHKSGGIRKGDMYKRIVKGGYHMGDMVTKTSRSGHRYSVRGGGPRWLYVTKKVVARACPLI